LNSSQKSFAQELTEKIDFLCSIQLLPLTNKVTPPELQYLIDTGFAELWNPKDQPQEWRLQLTVAGAQAIEALVKFRRNLAGA
jgi:hypothetical protein